MLDLADGLARLVRQLAFFRQSPEILRLNISRGQNGLSQMATNDDAAASSATDEDEAFS